MADITFYNCGLYRISNNAIFSCASIVSTHPKLAGLSSADA